MQRPDYIPAGYDGIELVGSVKALEEAKLGAANCALYPRRLTGDFNALALNLAKIGWEKDGIIRSRKNGFCQFNMNQLREIEPTLTDASQKEALGAIIADLRDVFKSEGTYPSLRVVGALGYARIGSSGVEEFHADGGEDRLLCCYTDPVTELLRSDQAILNEETHKYDAAPGAEIFSFRAGDLWKQAGSKSENTLPLIHRAPLPLPGRPPRLLIAG